MRHLPSWSAACLVLLLGLSTASAEVPRLINHEGLLLDAQGEPMEGPFTITFRLYDTAAGPEDDALWEETHDVMVSSGYYQLLLGATEGLSMQDFVQSETAYLGIAINGGAELAPRQQLSAVPYALVAEDVAGHIHPTTITVGDRLVIDEQGRWVGDNSGLVGAQGPAGDDGVNCYDGLVDRTGDGVVDVADCVGADGPQGVVGPRGERGPAGDEGSPDTPAQVLGKLNEVDEAAGSDLNADKLDGLDSTAFVLGNTDDFLRSDRDTATSGSMRAFSYSVGDPGAPYQVISSNGEWTGEPITDVADEVTDLFVRKAASHLYRSTRLSTLRVRASGYEFDGNQDRNIVLDGADLSGNGRGLHLVQIDLATHEVVHNQQYDTHASAAAATSLAERLNASNSDLLTVVASYDAWESELHPAAQSALMRCGASYTVGLESHRSAYLLIGTCGVGVGNGIELHQRDRVNAKVEVLTLLVDGAVVGLNGGGSGGSGAPVEGDLVVGGNVIMDNGSLRSGAGSFGMLRSTTPGASGYVFQEADADWGLYYDGDDNTFVFTSQQGGAPVAQTTVDLETGNIFTRGWIEALGTITSHSQLRVTHTDGDLFLEHDGTDALVGATTGDLRLTPAGGDVRVEQRLAVGDLVSVGTFPLRSNLQPERLELPTGSGSLVPDVGINGARLRIRGAGNSEDGRTVEVQNRLFVGNYLEVDGTIRSDPVEGANGASGGKLQLGGTGDNGDVTIQDYNGDLRIYTRSGATRTVRIFGWSDGVADLEVEGVARFEGGIELQPGAQFVVPGATADSLGQVGVGTGAPARQVHVFSTTGEAGLRLETATGGGTGSWDLVTRDDGSLYFHNVPAGADRLRLEPSGRLHLLSQELHMQNHNVVAVNGIQFNDPGGRTEGLWWHGTGGPPTAIYVSADKDGAANADGAIWFNSDQGFVWADNYNDNDEDYRMRLSSGGDLNLKGRLGVQRDPSANIETQGINNAGNPGGYIRMGYPHAGLHIYSGRADDMASIVMQSHLSPDRGVRLRTTGYGGHFVVEGYNGGSGWLGLGTATPARHLHVLHFADNTGLENQEVALFEHRGPGGTNLDANMVLKASNEAGSATGEAQLAFQNDTMGANAWAVGTNDDEHFQIGWGAIGEFRSNHLRILQNGNVGIGLVTPEAMLDVSGTGRVRGNMTVNGNMTVDGSMTFGSLSLNGTLNMNNHHILDVGAIELNDGGPNEGLHWVDQANDWAIGASSKSWDRADCNSGDCDLHIYGAGGDIRMWRPTRFNSHVYMENHNIYDVGSLQINDGGAHEGIWWPDQGNSWGIDASLKAWDRGECNGGDCDLHIHGTGGDIRVWRPTRHNASVFVESGRLGVGTTSAAAQLDVRGGNGETPAIHSQGGVYVRDINRGTGHGNTILRVLNEWGRGTTDLIQVGFYLDPAHPEVPLASLGRHDAVTRISSWRRSDVPVPHWCDANAAPQDCYQTKLNFIDVGSNGVYTPSEMVVGGSMSVGKTDAPGERLDVNGSIRATSAIYTTGNADYRHPTCVSGGWTCISTYVFTSAHYYGAASNSDIWIGESANNVRVRGYINNPDGELRLNDTIRTGTVHSDGQLHIHSWDAIVHTDYGGHQHDLIGYYHGWDQHAIYIAGYVRDTQRVIIGHSGGTVDLHVSGDIYSRGVRVSRGRRIQAVSVGCYAPGTCGYVRLRVDGAAHEPGGRGFQCMRVNRTTGDYHDRGSWDTYGDGGADDRMLAWLRARRDSNYILVCGVQDEGANRLGGAVRDELRLFGAHRVHSLGYRNAYVLIGRYGYAPGEGFECRQDSRSGSCRIAVTHTDIW